MQADPNLRWAHLFKGTFSDVWTHLIKSGGDDDDEFRFNDASTHEGHLRQNGETNMVL